MYLSTRYLRINCLGCFLWWHCFSQEKQGAWGCLKTFWKGGSYFAKFQEGPGLFCKFQKVHSLVCNLLEIWIEAAGCWWLWWLLMADQAGHSWADGDYVSWMLADNSALWCWGGGKVALGTNWCRTRTKVRDKKTYLLRESTGNTKNRRFTSNHSFL